MMIIFDGQTLWGLLAFVSWIFLSDTSHEQFADMVMRSALELN